MTLRLFVPYGYKVNPGSICRAGPAMNVPARHQITGADRIAEAFYGPAERIADARDDDGANCPDRQDIIDLRTLDLVGRAA